MTWTAKVVVGAITFLCLLVIGISLFVDGVENDAPAVAPPARRTAVTRTTDNTRTADKPGSTGRDVDALVNRISSERGAAAKSGTQRFVPGDRAAQTTTFADHVRENEAATGDVLRDETVAASSSTDAAATDVAAAAANADDGVERAAPAGPATDERAASAAIANADAAGATGAHAADADAGVSEDAAAKGDTATSVIDDALDDAASSFTDTIDDASATGPANGSADAGGEATRGVAGIASASPAKVDGVPTFTLSSKPAPTSNSEPAHAKVTDDAGDTDAGDDTNARTHGPRTAAGADAATSSKGTPADADVYINPDWNRSATAAPPAKAAADVTGLGAEEVDADATGADDQFIAGDLSVADPAGSHITIPAISEDTRSTAPTHDASKLYTIAPNDTFSSIAAARLGDVRHADALVRANPDVDPRRLQVGQVIRLPDVQAGVTAEPAPTNATTADTTVDRPTGAGAADRDTITNRDATTPAAASATDSDAAGAGSPDAVAEHEVKAGETLWAIAASHYRRGDLWRHIYEANRDVIGEKPGRLRAGMTLRIPPKPAPASN